jgi:hypothetical protein
MTALLASAPALPLDEAGKYVAGAYVVFLVLIVIYVAIMAAKLQRIERELRHLAAFAEEAGIGTEAGTHPGPGEINTSEAAFSDDASEVSGAAPGRGSEGQSISVSSGPSGSRGGGA